MKECIIDKMRMLQWPLIAAALYAVAMLVGMSESIKPASTVLWKAGHLTVGAYIGYWVDRNAFQFSRLSKASSDMQEIRRAIIISAAIVAVALGM